MRSDSSCTAACESSNMGSSTFRLCSTDSFDACTCRQHSSTSNICSPYNDSSSGYYDPVKHHHHYYEHTYAISVAEHHCRSWVKHGMLETVYPPTPDRLTHVNSSSSAIMISNSSSAT